MKRDKSDTWSFLEWIIEDRQTINLRNKVENEGERHGRQVVCKQEQLRELAQLLGDQATILLKS